MYSWDFRACQPLNSIVTRILFQPWLPHFSTTNRAPLNHTGSHKVQLYIFIIQINVLEDEEMQEIEKTRGKKDEERRENFNQQFRSLTVNVRRLCSQNCALCTIEFAHTQPLYIPLYTHRYNIVNDNIILYLLYGSVYILCI